MRLLTGEVTACMVAAMHKASGITSPGQPGLPLPAGTSKCRVGSMGQLQKQVSAILSDLNAVLQTPSRAPARHCLTAHPQKCVAEAPCHPPHTSGKLRSLRQADHNNCCAVAVVSHVTYQKTATL